MAYGYPVWWKSLKTEKCSSCIIRGNQGYRACVIVANLRVAPEFAFRRCAAGKRALCRFYVNPRAGVLIVNLTTKTTQFRPVCRSAHHKSIDLPSIKWLYANCQPVCLQPKAAALIKFKSVFNITCAKHVFFYPSKFEIPDEFNRYSNLCSFHYAAWNTMVAQDIFSALS